MAVVSKGLPAGRQGFTLLELLVVISIIGILMAIGSVSFSTAQKKGRDSRRMGDMKAIQKSLEECYALDNKYPQTVSSDSSLECEGGTVTMNLVSDDPKPDEDYTYTVDANPATIYCLCAELENTGAGNASDVGSGGSCSYAADDDYFCVSNQQ